MHVSLWQQFSSNHSGFFWVVGTFQTVEAAQNAYNELRTMLQTIDRWHREHPDAITQITNDNPLPPEAEFARKYNVPWPTTIDWTNWANYRLVSYPGFENIDPQKSAEALIDDVMSVVGEIVVVTNPDQTWMTIQPFKALLEHFGAKTIGFDLDHMGGWEQYFFRLTCTAPNVGVAERLKQLPPSIDLKSLTVEQHQRELIYEFQITVVEVIKHLRAVLRSNGCTDIQMELFEKSE